MSTQNGWSPVAEVYGDKATLMASLQTTLFRNLENWFEETPAKHPDGRGLSELNQDERKDTLCEFTGLRRGVFEAIYGNPSNFEISGEELNQICCIFGFPVNELLGIGSLTAKNRQAILESMRENYEEVGVVGCVGGASDCDFTPEDLIEPFLVLEILDELG